MRAVRMMFRRLRSDKRGATAIEYGLIAALIAVALVASVKNLGGGTSGMWSRVASNVDNAT